MASAKDDKQFKYDAGNTLLALREKAGMTQPELAEKIHVEPNSVHRYEKGERQMSLHTAYEASVAFGVPMESNRSKTVAINEAASLDCDGSDWSDAVMVDFLDEENAEMLAEEELRKLYAAMGKLTERQQKIIQLYFYKGLTQYEIAEELGIARPVVSKTMTAAIKKLKKSF